MQGRAEDSTSPAPTVRPSPPGCPASGFREEERRGTTDLGRGVYITSPSRRAQEEPLCGGRSSTAPEAFSTRSYDVRQAVSAVRTYSASTADDPPLHAGRPPEETRRPAAGELPGAERLTGLLTRPGEPAGPRGAGGCPGGTQATALEAPPRTLPVAAQGAPFPDPGPGLMAPRSRNILTSKVRCAEPAGSPCQRGVAAPT